MDGGQLVVLAGLAVDFRLQDRGRDQQRQEQRGQAPLRSLPGCATGPPGERTPGPPRGAAAPGSRAPVGRRSSPAPCRRRRPPGPSAPGQRRARPGASSAASARCTSAEARRAASASAVSGAPGTGAGRPACAATSLPCFSTMFATRLKAMASGAKSGAPTTSAKASSRSRAATRSSKPAASTASTTSARCPVRPQRLEPAAEELQHLVRRASASGAARARASCPRRSSAGVHRLAQRVAGSPGRARGGSRRGTRGAARTDRPRRWAACRCANRPASVSSRSAMPTSAPGSLGGQRVGGAARQVVVDDGQRHLRRLAARRARTRGP